MKVGHSFTCIVVLFRFILAEYTYMTYITLHVGSQLLKLSYNEISTKVPAWILEPKNGLETPNALHCNHVLHPFFGGCGSIMAVNFCCFVTKQW